MRKIAIADTGALISLAHAGQIALPGQIFDTLFIPTAVWLELQNYSSPYLNTDTFSLLSKNVVAISAENFLMPMMGFGESESMILYKELKADFLIVDDQKARTFAESLDIHCVGSIGLLIKAKEKGLLNEIRPIFERWLTTGRFFSRKLLNEVLRELGEPEI